MGTIQLQNLLSYLDGLSLTMSNKKWLAEHLVSPTPRKVSFTEQEFRKKLAQSSAEAANGQYVEMKSNETGEQFINRMLCI